MKRGLVLFLMLNFLLIISLFFVSAEIYDVQTTKQSKLFGFIPVTELVTLTIDAETGQIVRQRSPLWGILARDVGQFQYGSNENIPANPNLGSNFEPELGLCYDGDNGLNSRVASFTIKDGQESEDVCYSSSRVREYYCVENEISSRVLVCEGDSICAGGACVNEASSDCTPDWNCSDYSACINGQQTRVCTDLNSCGVAIGKPPEVQICTSLCTPEWECEEWSACLTGQQTRKCEDSRGCNISGTNIRIETENCVLTSSPSDSPPDLVVTGYSLVLQGIVDVYPRAYFLINIKNAGGNLDLESVEGANVILRSRVFDTSLLGTALAYDERFLPYSVASMSPLNFNTDIARTTGFNYRALNWYELPGTHSVEFCIDAENNYIESNESNNCLIKTFTIP